MNTHSHAMQFSAKAERGSFICNKVIFSVLSFICSSLFISSKCLLIMRFVLSCCLETLIFYAVLDGEEICS